MPEVRLIDANALINNICDECISPEEKCDQTDCLRYAERNRIESASTIEAEPVRHGRWIECDYKHMEHGVIETEPKAGLCCSECRTGFKKNRMTYKAFCPACGARMDASGTNIDLLCKINRGMLAGYECIMEVFVDEIDNSTVNIAERCGDYSANCEKCIADYLNEYPFCSAKSDGGDAE